MIGGAPATSGCSMACKGNATEYCGGSNRLNMYQFGTVSSTSSASQSSTPTSSTSSSSTAQSTPTSPSSNTAAPSSTSTTSTASSASSSATGLPSGWSYRGCYVDNANGRILLKPQPGSTTMTIEKCVGACVTAGYSVAGVEYARSVPIMLISVVGTNEQRSECFCGNAIVNGGSLAASDSQCNMNCGGNAAEKCGAGSRMSVYAIGPLITYPIPSVQTTGLPGKWEYKGCIS